MDSYRVSVNPKWFVIGNTTFIFFITNYFGYISTQTLYIFYITKNIIVLPSETSLRLVSTAHPLQGETPPLESETPTTVVLSPLIY